jgi:hypothetical protein
VSLIVKVSRRIQATNTGCSLLRVSTLIILGSKLNIATTHALRKHLSGSTKILSRVVRSPVFEMTAEAEMKLELEVSCAKRGHR